MRNSKLMVFLRLKVLSFFLISALVYMSSVVAQDDVVIPPNYIVDPNNPPAEVSVPSITRILSHNPDPSVIDQAVMVEVSVFYEDVLDINLEPGDDFGSRDILVTSSSSSNTGPSCSVTIAYGGGSGSCDLIFLEPGNYQIKAEFPGLTLLISE